MKETKLRLFEVFEYRKPIKADMGNEGSMEKRISLVLCSILLSCPSIKRCSA
ncbi:hypothetical protein GNIT_1679 [Glaciecola nitratireducens FR1064]|uniref:Uncharacterized protein n=1 Tax=Glaciecola nitratireducens (strain JCM 12485 / KCTC 12276 / FR1064) TaxID=1085623 RepID=G4QLC8_GLANF|nr:hypothetical protein GNIT_1679 [Glaciecola nitratireducens FR1064]